MLSCVNQQAICSGIRLNKICIPEPLHLTQNQQAMDSSQEKPEDLLNNHNGTNTSKYLQQIKDEVEKHYLDLEQTKAKLSEIVDENKKLKKILEHTFMYSVYKALNTDLASLDAHSLLEHYISNGFQEGRRCDENAAKEIQTAKYAYLNTRTIQELSRTYLNKNDSQKRGKETNQENENNKSKTISKTIGTRLSLEENKDFRFAIKHTLYEPKTKCLASFIPKNGCTNLRYSFALANNLISSQEDIDWVHSNNQSMNASLENIQNSEYSFVILRNPYERLASAFWNKFIGSSEEGLVDQSGDIFRNILNKGRINKEINSFKDFVNSLWEDPFLISRDSHLRYQTDFLLLSNYNKYFSLNDFKILQDTLLEKINLKIVDTRNFAKHTTFGYEEKPERYYGSCSIEKLAEIKSQKMSIKYKNFYDEEDSYRVAVLYYNDIVTYAEKTSDFDSVRDYLRKALVYSTHYQI